MTLQNAQTTGNGTVAGASYMSQCRESAIYVAWSTTTTGGRTDDRIGHDASYTGTWAPLTTVTWTAANKEDIVQIHRGSRGAPCADLNDGDGAGGSASAYLSCN